MNALERMARAWRTFKDTPDSEGLAAEKAREACAEELESYLEDNTLGWAVFVQLTTSWAVATQVWPDQDSLNLELALASRKAEGYNACIARVLKEA